MSFFDSIPKPPPRAPERHPRPAWLRPEAVLPGSVQGELVLARTDEVAIAIGSIRAYPNGFEFTVHVRFREAAADFGPGHDPFSWHRRGHGGSGPPDVLRLGVAYADGRRTATTSGQPGPGDEDDGQLRLMHQGGGGSALGFDQNFWLYPLPPQGPVAFVAAWLEFGVPEVTAEIDAAAIQAAAERAVVLWPEQPGDESCGAWNSETITAHRPAKAGEE